MTNSYMYREYSELGLVYEEEKRSHPIRYRSPSYKIHFHHKIKLIRQVVMLVVIALSLVNIDVIIEHPNNVICMCTVPLNGTNELNDCIIQRL